MVEWNYQWENYAYFPAHSQKDKTWITVKALTVLRWDRFGVKKNE